MNKLISDVEKLPKASRLKILEYIVDLEISVSESSSGCHVNLDKLTPGQLNGLKLYIESLSVKIPDQYLI
jgi:hypothetical protein